MHSNLKTKLGNPETLLAYLNEVCQQPSLDVITAYDLLVLAEGCVGNATLPDRSLLQADRLKWAHIAIRIYECLAAKGAVASPSSAENSSFMFRARMIAEYGVQHGHPLLDPESIRSWFLGATELSPEQATLLAQQLFAEWKRTGVPKMELLRELRGLKNRLSIIEKLVDLGIWTDDTEMMRWHGIREQLP